MSHKVCSLVAPDPPRKEGLVKLCTKFSVRNFNWMTFTGYTSVIPTLIQPDPLEVRWYHFISSVKPNPIEMIGFIVHFHQL